jgi:hypothetical protein
VYCVLRDVCLLRRGMVLPDQSCSSRPDRLGKCDCGKDIWVVTRCLRVLVLLKDSANGTDGGREDVEMWDVECLYHVLFNVRIMCRDLKEKETRADAT